MSKGLLTGFVALVAVAMICQDTNAQHFGQGRLSNAIHTHSANMFGGANCGREISYADASNLWADYCFDDCTVGSGCGSRCNTGCRTGCNNAYTPISQPLSCGSCGSNSCGGGCTGKLKSKLSGLFSGGFGGGLGCGNGCGGGCFGWPGGCGGHGFGYPAGNCGGCGFQAAPVSNSCGSCGNGCGHGHHLFGGLLHKLHGHRNHCGGGCGCKLFSRGNYHDRMFSNFYSRCGSRMNTGYFGGYVGYETGFGCAHSHVNGVLTGACGCTPASPAMQPAVHNVTPAENPHAHVHPTVEATSSDAN